MLAAGADKHALRTNGDTAYTLAGRLFPDSAPAIRALLAAAP